MVALNLRWGFPGAVPQALLISPRWGFPGAVPQALLISPRWGFPVWGVAPGYINLGRIGARMIKTSSSRCQYQNCRMSSVFLLQSCNSLF